MGDRYTLPAGIWNSVMSVSHFSFGAAAVIETLLEFPAPVFQEILIRVTQLTNGLPGAFAKLDEELDRSNSVFLRIHELPPDSPNFYPDPTKKIYSVSASFGKNFTGLPGGTRTHDLQLRRLLLYPVELRADILAGLLKAADHSCVRSIVGAGAAAQMLSWPLRKPTKGW